MAVHKRHMMSILMRNGHLVVEGDESTEDLRMALRYLRAHTIVRCKKPHMGIPIETFLPDISVIEVGHTRPRNVQSMANKKERL